MISWNQISYDRKYLTVFSSEAVVFQIDRIASSLGPSTVELALPLNATKGLKLSFATVIGDQIVLKYGVQLPHSPLLITLGRYVQLLLKVLTNPCCQFGR